MDANGTVPLDDRAMAVNVDLNAFPLAALNSTVTGQALGGTITGSARVRAQCAGAGVCLASGVSAGVVACARGRWCAEVAAAVSLVWWLALAAPGWDVAIRGLISIAMAPPSRPRRASRNTMQQDRKR